MKVDCVQTKEELVKQASLRWLLPQEISNMIYSFESLGFVESNVPPSDPVNGQLLFYDRRVVKNFKTDGVSWVVRKGSDRVQETYQSLKIDGVDRLLGMYSRSATQPSFRRRIYRTSDASDPRSDKVLIHYRDYPDGDETQKLAKVSKNPKKSKPKVSLSRTSMMTGGAHNMHMDPLLLNEQYMSMPDGEMDIGQDDEDYEDGDIFGCYGIDEDTRQELLSLIDMPIAAQAAPSPFTAAAQGLPPQLKPSSTSPGWGPNAAASTRPPRNPAAARAVAPPAPPKPSKDITFIAEFSPSRDLTPGGEKVLVVLGRPIPAHFLQSPVQVSFGQVGVIADILSPSVLRCHAPPHIQGCFPLCIGTFCGHALSPWSEQGFEFLSPEALINSLMPRISSDPSEFLESRRDEAIVHTKLPASNQAGQEVQPSTEYTNGTNAECAPYLGKRGCISPNRNLDPHVNCTPSVETLREHKIRIVERLGTVKSALVGEGDDGLDGNIDDSNVSQAQKDWLDDIALSQLDSAQLEAILEQYQLSLVQQLVHLATLDGDVKTEVDALDSEGYSLLHYCSLYNLLTIIPALLQKGASINQKTACGSSALHLAICSGNLEISQLMLQHGADVYALNAEGLNAFDCAKRGGDSSMMRLVTEFCLRAGITPPPAQSSDEQIGRDRATSLISAPFPSEIQPYLLDTFSNLSLADKCALSLSLESFSQQEPVENSSANLNEHDSSILINPELSPQSAVLQSRWQDEALELKMKSVISDKDKASLGQAMSMMGPSELSQLSEEVRSVIA